MPRHFYNNEHDIISEVVFEILYCNDANLNNTELEILTSYYKEIELCVLSKKPDIDKSRLLKIINEIRFKVFTALSKNDIFQYIYNNSFSRKEDR